MKDSFLEELVVVGGGVRGEICTFQVKMPQVWPEAAGICYLFSLNTGAIGVFS
jgi:hypothetical protein